MTCVAPALRLALALAGRAGGSLPCHREGIETRTSTRGLLAQVQVRLMPGRERGEQGPEWLRSAEGITLAVRHAEGHQSLAYRLGFNVLGHGLQPEFTRNPHDRLDHGYGARTAEQIADEDPIDLDAADRQFLAVGERRQPRPKIVERKAS